jgi:hypothetical protein
MQGMEQPFILKGFHEGKLIGAVIDFSENRTGRAEVNLNTIAFQGSRLNTNIILSGKQDEQNKDADYGIGGQSVQEEAAVQDIIINPACHSAYTVGYFRPGVNYWGSNNIIRPVNWDKEC